MRSRALIDTLAPGVKARDTAERETPARLATSAAVTNARRADCGPTPKPPVLHTGADRKPFVHTCASAGPFRPKRGRRPFDGACLPAESIRDRIGLSEAGLYSCFELIGHAMKVRIVPVEIAQHQSPFEGRDNLGRVRARIALHECLLCHAFLDDVLEAEQQLLHGLCCCAAQPRSSMVGFDGEVRDRTSAAQYVIEWKISENGDQRKKLFLRGRVVPDHVENARLHASYRVLERFKRKVFQAFEVMINATFLEAGDAHDVRHRRAEIAGGIEQSRRLLEDPLSGRLAVSLDHASFPRREGLYRPTGRSAAVRK